MVPVVRNAENLTFRGVADIKRLAIRVMDKSLLMMTGGTLLSLTGVFGSMLSTPIINPPQSGTLNAQIIERPML
jgi:pyruvate/2-oxoglutarate dehydrogenase complex dihydrolipoamide acyltransferase (E2) component